MPFKDKKEQKEYNRAYHRKWYKKNKKKADEVSRRYQRTPKGKLSERKRRLKRLYSITLEEYDRMLELQNGVCAICGNPPEYRRLGIDHDHKTGKVRGLLCGYCNGMIGRIEKNPQFVSNVIEYLK